MAFVIGVILCGLFVTYAVFLLEVFGFFLGAWLVLLSFCALYLIARRIDRWIGDPDEVYSIERRNL